MYEVKRIKAGRMVKKLSHRDENVQEKKHTMGFSSFIETFLLRTFVRVHLKVCGKCPKAHKPNFTDFEYLHRKQEFKS